VTPLQMCLAYGAIANGGVLMIEILDGLRWQIKGFIDHIPKGSISINGKNYAVEKYGGKLIFTESALYSSSSVINKNFDYINSDARKFINSFIHKLLFSHVTRNRKKSTRIFSIG
jgi:hypothetical protein